MMDTVATSHQQEQLQQQHVFVTPGTRLGSVEEYDEIEQGTYVHDGHIYASIAGFLYKTTIQKENDENEKQKKKTENKTQLLQVMQWTGKHDDLLVPEAGSIVTCRVLKVSQFQARVSILCVDGKALRSDFPGVIRVQDVRQTEIDKVVMAACFRPGDIVQAQVISLGDQRNYYLTTAKNDFGVIYAKSASGGVMVPVDWQTMQCTRTRMRETRKVAQVFV